MVQTPGQKAFGLQLLENNRDFLSDFGHIPLFRAMIEKVRLLFDLRNIDINNDYPDEFLREPQV